jgi:dsDNA-specific endonuclease/ATPase MutS2
MGEGSRDIRLAEDIRTRAAVIRLKNGEREALITNLDEAEVETSAFPGLYHKRRAVETKYKQVKQKLEKRKLQRAACG